MAVGTAPRARRLQFVLPRLGDQESEIQVRPGYVPSEAHGGPSCFSPASGAQGSGLVAASPASASDPGAPPPPHPSLCPLLSHMGTC